MTSYYDSIGARSKGAWVVHHAQKTSATVNGAAEFPALDTAGKAASLLSQLAASEQSTVEKNHVDALAKAAGLNPRIELPALLEVLKRRRLIDVSTAGSVEVLGLTTTATVQHAAEIFEESDPTTEEKASLAIAELASNSPLLHQRATEFISDEFKLPSKRTSEFLSRAEIFGFLDGEGAAEDKLYFNGNIFRRDNIAKVARVLDSLSPADHSKVVEFNASLEKCGCLGVAKAEAMLGLSLLHKLQAAGMYDVNHVANASGEHGFITRPSAFHKFNDPLVDDAFDLAKTLVSALFYGMTQSAASRGKIDMIGALLGKLIRGVRVGPATAIGEDYRVLETKGVIRVTQARPYGYHMQLLKRDVGEMALQVLTIGEASSVNVARPLAGTMTGYVGPERSRSNFRRQQLPASKKMTEDVLQALRTRGEI